MRHRDQGRDRVPSRHELSSNVASPTPVGGTIILRLEAMEKIWPPLTASDETLDLLASAQIRSRLLDEATLCLRNHGSSPSLHLSSSSRHEWLGTSAQPSWETLSSGFTPQHDLRILQR
ncbi:hypothetical protein ACJRO7_025071 [Eucalyptus globulus]|uniref:Uncharacterized protein n=1 Tax=Eucalyptus globulus TaxID=34317 RepID=A0ABD3K8U0_EUCGL